MMIDKILYFVLKLKTLKPIQNSDLLKITFNSN